VPRGFSTTIVNPYLRNCERRGKSVFFGALLPLAVLFYALGGAGHCWSAVEVPAALAATNSGPVLREAREALGLSPQQLKSDNPVQIEAVVTYVRQTRTQS
jgi:hypothetical protein